MAIKWDIAKQDSTLLEECVDRLFSKFSVSAKVAYASRTDARMDLNAAHSNGCRLDFAKLLQFSDADFAHDVFGIHRHLNRKTGKLLGHFLPRCAAPSPAGARKG